MERTFNSTNVGKTMEAALQETGGKAFHSKRSGKAAKEKFLLEQEQNHTVGSLSNLQFKTLLKCECVCVIS